MHQAVKWKVREKKERVEVKGKLIEKKSKRQEIKRQPKKAFKVKI